MSEEGIVDPQEKLIDKLEQELADIEKQIVPETEEDGSTPPDTEEKDTQTPEEEDTTKAVEGEAKTEPEPAQESAEVKQQKQKMSELEIANKRWRDGMSWNTKLNNENISLRTKAEKLEAQLNELQEKLKAPDKPDPLTEALKDEWPDLTEKLVPSIKQLLSEKDKTVDEMRAELDNLRREQVDNLRREQVLNDHPDVALVMHDNSDFWNWLDRDTGVSSYQKKVVAESGSGKDLSILISQFKREYDAARRRIAPPPPTAPKVDNAAKNKQLNKDAAEATTEPRTKAKNPFAMPVKQKTALTAEQIANMSLDEFAKLTDDQLKAAALASSSMM